MAVLGTFRCFVWSHKFVHRLRKLIFSKTDKVKSTLFLKHSSNARIKPRQCFANILQWYYFFDCSQLSNKVPITKESTKQNILMSTWIYCHRPSIWLLSNFLNKLEAECWSEWYHKRNQKNSKRPIKLNSGSIGKVAVTNN